MSDPRAPAAPDLPELEGEERAQAEVVAFLSDPATHGGAAVERVDTHISRIFLAGDRAWKLKRAVKTNFLDFSTPARREAACRREMEVNRGGAGIYLGAVPIARAPGGGLALEGEGEAVDWVVAMRRFDRRDELDRVAERGELTRGMMEALADDLAVLHADSPETPEFGDAEDLGARIDQIAGALAAAAEGGPLEGRAEPWRRAARAAAEAQAPLVARRHALGRIRRCHGDLHLGNIVLAEGRPAPFDAIEFNEAIASIDVLYDLALTLADLIARGLRGHASALLSRYLGATRDHEGLALLPLFLSMRGAIRAMAAAGRGDAEEAARDLEAAEAALSARARPRLIAVGGVSGSGKSSVARRLAPDLAPWAGALAIRSDVTRKRLCGAAPEDPAPEGAYGARMNDRVMARMAWDARRTLRAGLPAILDATFLGEDRRACAARLAAEEGVPFDGVWLELSLETALARVGARRGDASDADAQVVRAQAERRARPADWIAVSAEGRPDAVAAEVLRRLLPDAGDAGEAGDAGDAGAPGGGGRRAD